MYLDDKLPRNYITPLVDMSVALLRRYPELTTTNPYKGEPFPLIDKYSVRMEKLFKTLIHVSTLINKPYRIQTKEGHYMSQEEDYINAMDLMKELITFFKVKKTRFEHEIVSLLEVTYQEGIEFTSKEIRQLTGFSSTHTDRIMRMLLDKDFIEIIEGKSNPRRGYVYRLKEQPKRKR